MLLLLLLILMVLLLLLLDDPKRVGWQWLPGRGVAGCGVCVIKKIYIGCSNKKSKLDTLENY